MLPQELINYILLFAPIEPPHFKPIDHLIRTYHEDHDWYAHKRGARFYHIKYLLSFSDYYFDTKDNDDYKYGQKYYEDFSIPLPPATREYEEWRQD